MDHPGFNPATNGLVLPFQGLAVGRCFFFATHMSQGRSTPCIGDGHTTFNRNPYNGYKNPYYWVDDHPLLYGNNGSLDPSTYAQVKIGNSPTARLSPSHVYVLVGESGFAPIMGYNS